METPSFDHLDAGLQWYLEPLGIWGGKCTWAAQCVLCDTRSVGPKEYVATTIELHVWEMHKTLSVRSYIQRYEEAIGRHYPDPSEARVELTEAGRAYLEERRL